MRQRTAQNLHAATQIIDNTHFSHTIVTALHFTALHFTAFHNTSFHFTSLHFTTLHAPFFTSLHLWKSGHRAPKTLHFSSVIVTFLTYFLKICDLQGETASASAGSLFYVLTVLFTKQYLPMSVLFFFF